MRGYAGPLVFLLSLLALFGGGVWLTRHPDAGIVRQAESWPFVGPLATRFRQRYTVPPPVPTAEEGGQGVVVEYVEPVIPPLGEGFVWVIPGTVMRREPSASSPKILQFDVIANVTRLEKRGDWYKVWRRGEEGWVYLEGYSDDEPPYGSDPEPVKPLPSAAPGEEALAAARSLLVDGAREVAAGPYKLYTDVDDGALLAWLGRVAGRVRGAYEQRYRRSPIDETPLEAIVLFAEEDSYRKLQRESAELLGLNAGGHTASGLAVLYVGTRPRWEVAATFVHEIVHTLNRRALGPALPSWLDEGLADDLSSSRIGEDGGIVLGSLGGERVESEDRFTMRGGIASLWKLRDEVRAGTLIRIPDLLHLGWKSFVRTGRSGQHYAAAAFWIRFLLDAEDGVYAEAFRGYLESISQGGPATPEALRERLGLPWNQLDARFQLWIEFQQTEVRVEPVEASSE